MSNHWIEAFGRDLLAATGDDLLGADAALTATIRGERDYHRRHALWHLREAVTHANAAAEPGGVVRVANLCEHEPGGGEPSDIAALRAFAIRVLAPLCNDFVATSNTPMDDADLAALAESRGLIQFYDGYNASTLLVGDDYGKVPPELRHLLERETDEEVK